MDLPASLGVVESVSLAAMGQLAARLAVRLKPSDTLALKGQVGAGKTTFAQSVIHAIALGKPEVTSPTFTLMQSYDVGLSGKPATLWHLDLYRLENPGELDALGLEELWPHVVLIEWPDIATAILPRTRLELAFDFGLSQDERRLTLRGHPAWAQRLEGIV